MPAGNHVAAKLVGQTGHIVEVELAANEHVIRQEDLDADSRVNLEMVGTPHGLALGRANGRPYAGSLRIGEAALGAADPAFNFHNGLLLIHRREDAIEIVDISRYCRGP